MKLSESRFVSRPEAPARLSPRFSTRAPRGSFPYNGEEIFCRALPRARVFKEGRWT